MGKTAHQIQGYVYRHLLASPLAAEVNGKVYRNGQRPRDSRAEDIIVTHTAGEAGQTQTGIVTVNIYVPDTDPHGNGVLTEDGLRCEQLEAAASEWAEAIRADSTEYDFTLRDTICTDYQPDIRQHFIVARLRYKTLSTD